MKQKRKTDYKSFTPLRCKCCNNYIDEDIHDSLCLDCLDAAFPENTDIEDCIQQYLIQQGLFNG